MAYTYILKCSDGTYYTGWTMDLSKRLKTHNMGKGAKYTRSRLPVSLVYWEWQENRSLAQKRESYLKGLTKEKKEEIINKFQPMV
ncbi:MAG TPA: GIY-YIG nuclease family protein [Eubacteriaceae bacterium]|jgi:putative endonuclease|nr:GIY-YIG nuclease family protein [Eubacteriaceae bacterium]